MKSINLKFLLVFLVSVAVVFSLSACGGGSDGDSDESGATEAAMTEAPAADATEAPAAEGGDVVAEFPFNNVGTEEVCELYLSPAGQEDWGPDQLGGSTIPAGESYTLQNIPAGSYDVKVIGCNGGEAIGQLEIQNP